MRQKSFDGRGRSSMLWQRRSGSPGGGASALTRFPLDDADVAAGANRTSFLPSPPPSGVSRMASQSDLEFFEDLVSEPVLVLGVDISHLSRRAQFLVCAAGVFLFSLLYGYLQELISVQIANRQLALFLAATQFAGYTCFSFVLRTYVYEKRQKVLRGRAISLNSLLPLTAPSASGSATNSANGSIASSNPAAMTSSNNNNNNHNINIASSAAAVATVPLLMYLGLSLLRALDLGMTNLAMQYINYPAKTLMKSSRVVFTMLFGVFITRKRYRLVDYLIVLCMVIGLAIFMHADAKTSAIFQPLGVVMLTVSLLCDGAISNMSEAIMNKFGVCQDEFIFRMYSIALVALSVAAAVKGDLWEGLTWLQEPGTYQEQQDHVPYDQRTWSVTGKLSVLLLFSCMGFFGSSCSAAITKNFGALTMSITSTARKATTLFLSFLLFDNACTMEHVVGIVIFITALLVKSWRRRGGSGTKHHHHHHHKRKLVRSIPSRPVASFSEDLVSAPPLPPSSSSSSTASLLLMPQSGSVVDLELTRVPSTSSEHSSVTSSAPSSLTPIRHANHTNTTSCSLSPRISYAATAAHVV